MELGEYREVYYFKYCPLCKYYKLDGSKEPCNECLMNPTNNYSHKPLNFKEADDKDKKESNQ